MGKKYDVLIVGGGISGAALLYILSRYTNVKNIALLEKYNSIAQVNSFYKNNSQTLHFGDIETNYTLEKATKVKAAAEMTKKYIERAGKKSGLFNKTHKMVLAAGDEEVAALEKRYEEFRKLFPKLKKMGRKELAKIEPGIVRGRKEKILALVSEDGYAVNFGRLSQHMIENALKNKKDVDLFLGTKVKKIKKAHGGYEIKTDKGTLRSKVLAVAAGAHSLSFAQALGYGKEQTILPVAGSFYIAPKKLNGKVYTMQLKKLPFAAVHGDPEVDDPSITRFGPTAKVLPLLERQNKKTFFDFLGISANVPSILSFFNILADWTIFKYVVRNFTYDIPFIGKRLFLKQAKKIVPSIKARELELAKGYGGIRPQIVNKVEKKLVMGEAKIVGNNVVFNMTPSPGASTCLKNGEADARIVLNFLGKKYKFNEALFRKDFNLEGKGLI